MREKTLEVWNSNKPSSYKRLSFYKKSSKGLSVSYCKGSHIMLEPCGHGLCYEPIL
jgi:hypothetical protein